MQNHEWYEVVPVKQRYPWSSNAEEQYLMSQYPSYRAAMED